MGENMLFLCFCIKNTKKNAMSVENYAIQYIYIGKKLCDSIYINIENILFLKGSSFFVGSTLRFFYKNIYLSLFSSFFKKSKVFFKS